MGSVNHYEVIKFDCDQVGVEVSRAGLGYMPQLVVTVPVLDSVSLMSGRRSAGRPSAPDPSIGWRPRGAAELRVRPL